MIKHWKKRNQALRYIHNEARNHEWKPKNTQKETVSNKRKQKRPT